MNKQAELFKRQQMYYACRAVLRTKYGSYAVPQPTQFMYKQAIFNPIGMGTGALSGGGMGYAGGNWLANKMGLDKNSWGAKALKWGGGLLGGLAGGALGNFAGPLAGKIMGGAGKMFGGAMQAAKPFAQQAIGAAKTWLGNSSNINGAMNTASKFLGNNSMLGKAVNFANNMGAGNMISSLVSGGGQRGGQQGVQAQQGAQPGAQAQQGAQASSGPQQGVQAQQGAQPGAQAQQGIKAGVGQQQGSGFGGFLQNLMGMFNQVQGGQQGQQPASQPA